MNKISSVKPHPDHSKAANASVAEALQIVLNDSHTLYHFTHHCHFNVEGKNFYGLHHLFEEQYNELFLSFDIIGERIRALGEYVYFADTASFDSSTKFKKIISIKNADEQAIAMINDLISLHDIVIASCQAAKSKANQADDDVTVDLMIARLTVLEKAKWMLTSSAK